MLAGGMSVAVPAELVGLQAAWRAYGRLPWADLVTPTIELLEAGVTINEPLAQTIQQLEDVIRQSPGLRYYTATQVVLKKYSIIHQWAQNSVQS